MNLMKHQQENLDFLSNRFSGCIFDEPGLGKTLVMLEHLKRLNNSSNIFPCLIVVPLSGVTVWQSEAIKYGYDFTFQELVGTYNTRIQRLKANADIYVINWDALRILNLHLKNKGFKTVIFDELHRGKERSSKCTKVAMELAQSKTYRYGLTGTPIGKSPEDIWSQMQIIEPNSLGNFYVFAARYIDYKKVSIRVRGGVRRKIRKPVKYKNLSELKERLSKFSIRHTMKECLDLPEKIYKVIECPLSASQKNHYWSLKSCLATMLNDEQFKITHAATLIQKLQQICQGFIYDDNKKVTIFESGKRKMLFDLLKDLEGEKIILFTWFRADAEILKMELEKKYKIILFDGSSEDRMKMVNEFQTSTEPMIFLSNVERAKECITLTDARHMIYFGNSWNYITRTQSENRAWRTGQTKSVIIYDFVCKNTVDELVYDALKYKGEMADKTLGDSKRLAELITQQKEE